MKKLSLVTPESRWGSMFDISISVILPQCLSRYGPNMFRNTKPSRQRSSEDLVISILESGYCSSIGLLSTAYPLGRTSRNHLRGCVIGRFSLYRQCGKHLPQTRISPTCPEKECHLQAIASHGSHAYQDTTKVLPSFARETHSLTARRLSATMKDARGDLV